jgi:hypothetical protein
MWISLTTEDCLDSLSHNCPCIVKVALQSLLIEDELAESLECALDSDNTMTERHTDVTEYY